MNMNAAILNRVGLNITDQSFIKPKDYEFKTLESELSFRRTADGLNVRNGSTANVQELLGESLVWNQRVDASYLVKNVPNGNTVTQLSNGYVRAEVAQGVVSGGVTISQTRTGIVVGHKYAVQVDLITSAGLTLYTLGSRKVNTVESTKFIVQATDTIIYLVTPNSATAEQGISFDTRLLLTDLTQMFGAGNEPTTVEEFETIKNQLVGVDFTAYNAGEVLGVNIKGIKSVNDNAFNGEFAKVLGGREYCADGTITSLRFAREIGGATEAIVLDSENKFTPSENGYVYASGTDICIHLVHTGYKDHVYTEHKVSESSFNLTPYFPYGMHGVNGVRDSVTKNKAVRRFGKVDLGTLNWIKNNEGQFYATLPNNGVGTSTSDLGLNIKCAKYLSGSAYNKNNGICTVNTRVWVYDLSYTDAATFKAAMSGVELVYELATPIETEIDPQLNMNYKVWNGGTEQMIADTPSTPVLANIRYKVNKTN